ncbi:phytanoyl-CoA dioxygenase family protein [bacterium]|nr:phytanoyl-CoA dioxygenase family protein [bacterium]
MSTLDSTYPLAEKQIARYQRDGHIVLREVLPRAEALGWRAPIETAVETWRRDRRPLGERETTYGRAFVQVTNLWKVDEKVRQFALARRFGRIAAELMGVDGVRMYHDQALIKEAGGGHTPWHQDQFYWPIASDKTITMWMPLVDCPGEMGPMVFASRQDKRGSRAQLAISDNSAAYFTKLARDEAWDLATYELLAGDATFHSGWAPHRATGNTTKETRVVMTIIFHAADAKVSEMQNEFQPKDLEAFFPGLKPGDVAASPLNPLVWSRS